MSETTVETRPKSTGTKAEGPYTVAPMDGGPMGKMHDVTGPGGYRSSHSGGKYHGKDAAGCRAADLNAAFAEGQANARATFPELLGAVVGMTKSHAPHDGCQANNCAACRKAFASAMAAVRKAGLRNVGGVA